MVESKTNRRSVAKPKLRRSTDFSYENLRLADITTTLASVTALDRDNDPPLTPLALYGNEGDDDDDSIQSLSTQSTHSTHDSFYQLSQSTAAVSLMRKRTLSSDIDGTKYVGLVGVSPGEKLEVVKVLASNKDKSTTNDYTGNGNAKESSVNVVDESDGIVSSRYSSTELLLREYSTDKPINFSLQASPVKKEETTLISLDCSFDMKSNTDEFVNESAWIEFDDQLVAGQQEESEEHVLGISPWTSNPRLALSEEEVADSFAPSLFPSLDKTHGEMGDASAKPSKDENAALRRELEQLRARLLSLEQIVHANEFDGNNPMQVSDSSHSKNSSVALPQNVAFEVYDDTESVANDDITCDDVVKDSKKQHKPKSSLKRRFLTLFFRSSRQANVV